MKMKNKMNYSFNEYVSYLTEGDNKGTKNFTMEDLKELTIKKYQTKQVLDLFNSIGNSIGDEKVLDFIISALNDGFVYSRRNILIKIFKTSSNYKGIVELNVKNFVFYFKDDPNNTIRRFDEMQSPKDRKLDKLFFEFLDVN